jgi:hypothetical protein
MNDLYCPIINGGLTIDLKSNGLVEYKHCCLRNDDDFTVTDFNFDFFNSKELDPLRKTNLKNIWDKGCATCRLTESSGHESFRTGMIKGLGKQVNLSGPTRLDLQFDIGCNLACRICGPRSSSLWQKHLLDNGLPQPVESYKNRADEMLCILKNLDLSNLKMVVFCGGETLLGNSYWKITKYLASVVPNITLCFQTNGTQSIHEKHYELLEKFDLVKLHISLDGIQDKFEYQRWPASWAQVTDNIFKIRETAPNNTMFLIEETLSILNVLYQNELETWHNNNFKTNKLGDNIDHTKHLAVATFKLDSITNEYYKLLSDNNLQNYVSPQWQENPQEVQELVKKIKQFDLIRDQDFSKTFPEVAECYARYL